MLRKISKRQFGLFQSLKNILAVPRKHWKNNMGAGGGNESPIGVTTQYFDDEAGEWQAAIVENTYELNSYQSMESVQQGNFGTIDNPHIIFTSDIPFRFVGCTGPPNEDDFESHELLYFLLREGPLQRCGSCGQVFKLVRLRDEFSAENDYYQSSMVRQDFAELGEADHWIQQSVIRMMPHSWEHTHFEAHSHQAISLKNPDEHDRIFTDPAFRLEQMQRVEQTVGAYRKTMSEIEHSINDTYGESPVEYSKEVYENVVNTEVALAELDRHFNRVQRFNMRYVLDPANHERREARLLERAQERARGRTILVNASSERELQFRDYYESDEEATTDLQKNTYNDRAKVLSSPDLRLEKYSFQETYGNMAEPDASSYIKRKVFRFKFRQALSKPEDHQRREDRMLEKMNSSAFESQLADLSERTDLTKDFLKATNSEAQKEYYELLTNQAVENYKNYFESELEEDFEYFNDLPSAEKKEFLDTFKDSGLITKNANQIVTHIVFPREHDPEEGLIRNALKVWNDLDSLILPVHATLNNVNLNQQIIDKAKKRLSLNQGETSIDTVQK